MIYLSQLARATPKVIQRNSTKVSISKVKAYIDKDDIGEHKYITANARSRGSNKRWSLVIRIYGKVTRKGTVKPNNNAWVSCSCPYWRYYCEVAVTARGSSSILISNTQMPKIRNPRMRPYLCKHLLRAIEPALKAPAKRRKVKQIDDVEIEQLARMLAPFIPKKA